MSLEFTASQGNSVTRKLSLKKRSHFSGVNTFCRRGFYWCRLAITFCAASSSSLSRETSAFSCATSEFWKDVGIFSTAGLYLYHRSPVFPWLPGLIFPSWQASVPVETRSPKTGAPLEGYRGRCDRSRCKCSRLLFTRPLLSHSIYYFCRFATRGLFSGGIPQNPVAARAKTNGYSVAVVTGVPQEPPHALHSLHYALPTFSLWLPSFNPVEKMTNSINSFAVK